MHKNLITILLIGFLFIISCSESDLSEANNSGEKGKKEHIDEVEFYKLVDYCNLYYAKAYTDARVNKDGRYSSVYRRDYRTRIKPKWEKAINTYSPLKYGELRGDIAGHKELSVLCDSINRKRNDFDGSRQGNDLIAYLIELPNDFERREYLLAARDILQKDLVNKIMKGNYDEPFSVEKPDKVILSKEKFSLSEGKRKKLKATTSPQIEDISYIWNSNNTNIVEVDRDGEITAKQPGNAIITVTVRNTDVSAICIVEVKEKANNGFVIFLIIVFVCGALVFFIYKNKTSVMKFISGSYVLIMRSFNKKQDAKEDYQKMYGELTTENQQLSDSIKKYKEDNEQLRIREREYYLKIKKLEEEISRLESRMGKRF